MGEPGKGTQLAIRGGPKIKGTALFGNEYESSGYSGDLESPEPTIISSRSASNIDPDSPLKAEFGTDSKAWNSKTALGKVLHEFVKLPHLLVVEVKVATKDNGNAVVSSRLRRHALEEYIQKALDEDANKVALHVNISKKDLPPLGADKKRPMNSPSKFKPSNILVIPFLEAGGVESTKERLNNSQAQPISAKKTYSKQEHRADEPITCTVERSYLLQSTEAAYSKYMNILLRHVVRLSHPLHIDEDSVVIEKVKANLTYLYSVGIRVKVHFSERSVMALAFDLAPILNSEVNTLELVQSHFIIDGSSGLDVKVRDFLRGLLVEKVGQDVQGGPFRIRDVRSSAEVGPIHFAEEEKPMTMRQYLRKHNIQFNDDTQPFFLADIGANKPFWVALDFLNLVANQTIHGAGHLTPKLQLFRKEIQRRNNLADWLFPYGRRVVKTMIGLGLLNPQSISEHHALHITPYPSGKAKQNSQVLKKEYVTEDSLEESSIGVIYVGQDYKSAGVIAAIARVQDALQKQDILPSSETIHIARFGSSEELILSQSKNRTALLKECKNCNVLLGIIDQDTNDSFKFKQVEAEIHRLGDRTIGAITVCTKKRTLKDFFSASTSDVTFPSSILRKVKFMKGHKTLKDIPIESYLSSGFSAGLIVVGAHIAHSAAERSTVKAPSVSALVVSQDNKCLVHFLASSRIESRYPTTKKDPFMPYLSSAKGVDRIENDSISELHSRLEEHFKTWKERNPSVTGSPRVVFYRWTNHTNTSNEHSNILEKERDEISHAYGDVFGTETGVPLTYVEVSKKLSKARELGKGPIFTLNDSNQSTLYPTNDPSAKFQYQVKHDEGSDGGLGIDRLRELTININNSAQLDGRPVLALPVHYAQQLGRRVLSYYDFLSRQPSNCIPSVAHELILSSAAGGATESAGDPLRNYVERILEKDYQGGHVRSDGHALTRPWKPVLDGTMFYV